MAGFTRTRDRGAGPTPAAAPAALRPIPVNRSPGELPPGRLRLATRPRLDRIAADLKTIGIVVVAALAACAPGASPVATITATGGATRSAASAGSRSYGPPPSGIRSLRSGLRHSPLPPRPCRKAATSAPTAGRPAAEKPDHRHRRLLRARRERPRRRRAAEQRDELAAPHSITSSARASSVGGTSRPSALAVLRLMTRSYLVGA